MADRSRIWARFPTKTLVLALVLVTAAVCVFALVDRVVPPPAQKDVVAKTRPDPAGKVAASPISAGPLVAIVAVLGGAVVAMGLLKRAMKGSRHVPGAEKVLKVRDVLMMGPKRAIYLIALEDRNLVVGLCGDAMTLLSEYSETCEDEAPAVVSPAAATHATRTGELEAPRATTVAEAPALAATLDVEIGDDTPAIAAERAETKPAPAVPRAFSFGSARPDAARAQKARTDRIPHKFRQLLEKAAQSDGAAR